MKSILSPIKQSLLIVCVLLGVSASSFAQQTATASANVSATIITPISISKTTDLNFGNVAVSTTSGGTVVITPAGVRTPSGGVTLPATAGSPAAASFTVTGQDNYTYSITLPAGTITIANGGNNMTVGTFTSTPSGSAGALTSGTQTVTVGATLTVSAAQATGTYTLANGLNVSVNYN